jgi:hypothetical protein
MNPEQVAGMAEDFWERAGIRLTFPRNLERVILLTSPVFIVWIPNLRPSSGRGWLWQRGMRLPLAVQDRPLSGCIVAYRGRAGIFLEERLADEEARVVLAHEFAHYLADYELPRARAARRLGPEVLAALDGERPPTDAEGLAATLTGVSLKVHTHYMDRDFDPGRLATTDRVEQAANELACELLAPRQEVLARTTGLPETPAAWSELLAGVFGLPLPWANAYAVRMLRERGRRSFSDILGI